MSLDSYAVQPGPARRLELTCVRRDKLIGLPFDGRGMVGVMGLVTREIWNGSN